MAGTALVENGVNVGILIAQLPPPQGQLGPELCLRRDSQNIAPGAPSLAQSTDELPVPSKRDISHPEGMQVHLYFILFFTKSVYLSIYLSIWLLRVLVATCGIFSCGM